MLGSPAGPGGNTQRGLWPLAPATAPTATNTFSTDGISKYGVYSLFPGGPSFGSALYSHASTIGRFASGQFQQSSGNTFHTAQKFSDSLFSASGYTFGNPTPPPGSPYSPIPVAQLELLTKGFNSNIIIQPTGGDYPQSPKKLQEKLPHCDEKCCNLKAKACGCQLSSPTKLPKFSMDAVNGCSRTNPLDWACTVNVKKEPGACQVAEITTSALSPMVKVEMASPPSKQGDISACGIGGSIPVGIAIARQRVPQDLMASPSLPPAGLLTTVNGGAQIKEIARISELDPSMATAAIGSPSHGTVLQCTDDRGNPLAASWQMGGAQAHGQPTLATPTLWQYPASIPMEPMVPLPVPMPPVGFQLVRDPTTGSFLLLPTTGIEPLQQAAVVWPSYTQPSSVLLPSLPPIPPPPLQLLSSASSDYLSSSTTLHQHTQTHSTRLVAVTTDAKRKIPMPIPATTLIKIETDATLDQTKTLQAVSAIGNNTGTVYTDQNMAPLVTTHVIYQHPTNLILSQTPTGETTSCRSQATSPVTLTPPPEFQPHEEEPPPQSAVQDASNQTDTPICSEDDNTTHTMVEEHEEIREREITDEKQNFDIVEDLRYTEETAAVRTITDISEELNQAEIVEAIPAMPSMEHIEEPVEISIPELPDRVEESQKDQPEATKSIQKPDLSGLELLSNSIVEFESCRNSIDEDVPITSPEEISTSTSAEAIRVPTMDDSLGGLDLLCALAEQRILEENEKPREKERSKERRREKRKSKKHSSDEPRRKKAKSDKHHSRDREHRKRKDRHSSDKTDADREKKVCSCQDNYRTYKSPQSEEEVKKFIASKSQSICCKGDWPCMNAMELDMRMKLAELQRQYREKQKELSKLKPKKHSADCSKKRSRKKSTHSSNSDRSERSSTPPPLLDKMDIPVKPNNKDMADLLKPPTLCAMPRLEDIYRINQSDPDSSPEKHSSSKKRKVGRPKKLMASSAEHDATETIVAKKPKSKFVGYLLAAKEKLKLQNKSYPDATPPRYLEETVTIRYKKNKNNNHIISNDLKSSKIRPKLKAEATVKSYEDDEHYDWDTIIEDEEQKDEIKDPEVGEGAVESDEDMELEENIDSSHNIEKNIEVSCIQDIASVEIEDVKKTEDKCTLTAELLEVDKLRVLTAMGGLFYAGKLNAVEPPDVYSITLDGERGNRPHIMSREEILRDAIVEVAPKSTEDLPVGTRLCAYWSQQYRCLYPGSVAEPGTPDPQLDGRFVSVEFDDGDSGRIALEDIRFLPVDYPIIEYDPNPLLSLSKRRRRASTSVSIEEKTSKMPRPTFTPSETSTSQNDQDIEKENKDINKQLSEITHKEKKRLKKKRREDKKKKRKHKCSCNEDNCEHKHRKKHRKHKKHSDKEKEIRQTELIEEKEVTQCDEAIEKEEVENVEDELLEEEEVVENIGDLEDEDIEEAYGIAHHIEETELEDYPNPDEEVTMDDIIEARNSKKSKKIRDRQESSESRSKMKPFLPTVRFWGWVGKGYKRQRGKGRNKKFFYKSIQRDDDETITVGDAAVFLSTASPERPYIGRIVAMWELKGFMRVNVKWFYHPEETACPPTNFQYRQALFESDHCDVNDVQTISHKCEVLPLEDYLRRLNANPLNDNSDFYYLAGYYDAHAEKISMVPGIPHTEDQ